MKIIKANGVIEITTKRFYGIFHLTKWLAFPRSNYRTESGRTGRDGSVKLFGTNFNYSVHNIK